MSYTTIDKKVHQGDLPKEFDPKNISAADQEDFVNAYRKLVTRQIRSVYIDLAMLQDVYLGAILQHCHNDQSYDAVYKAIPKYNNRCTVTHTNYFPTVALSEETLVAYVKDPKNSHTLIMESPYTSMTLDLPVIHEMVLRDNKVRESQDVVAVESLHYIINTYPMKLEETDLRIMKQRFSHILRDGRFTFSVFDIPPWEIDKQYHDYIDVWYMYNFPEVVTHEDSAFARSFFKDMNFKQNLFLIAPRITEQEHLAKLHTYSQTELHELERNILLMLNICAPTKFYRTTIATDDTPPDE